MKLFFLLRLNECLVHFSELYFNYPKDLVANKKKQEKITFFKQLTKNK